MPRYQTLMPIKKKGDGAPLFCVHGQPLRLAQRMRSDRPIYGLSHVYYKETFDEAPHSIEELATIYLSEVRQVQPTGPYFFCGFSLGGMLAYEMSRQLLEAGETIGGLTLVEPSIPVSKHGLGRKLATWKQKSENNWQFTKAMWHRIVVRIRLKSIRNFRVIQASYYFAIKKPLPEKLRWLGYLKSLGPAKSNYKYTPIDCSAVVLYGHTDKDSQKLWTDYWNQLLKKGIKVEVFHDVRDHVGFMVDPALTHTVELIERTHNEQA
jgi:thioesterase domain-containing protein